MGKTSDQYKAESAAAYAKCKESYERFDTDGFLSQEAHSWTARLAARKAELADADWKSEFRGLFSAITGQRMRAKRIHLRCRFSGEMKAFWSFRNADGSIDKSQRLIPDTDSKRGKLHRAGYVVKLEMAPADVRLAGDDFCYLAEFRTDAGYPADAVAPF